MIAVVISACLCVIASLSSCNAQLSSYLDTAAIASHAKAVLSAPGSSKDAFYATKILQDLKVSDFKCNCNAIKSLTSDLSEGYEIYYGVSAANACGCSISAPSVAETVIEKALQVRTVRSIPRSDQCFLSLRNSFFCYPHTTYILSRTLPTVTSRARFHFFSFFSRRVPTPPAAAYMDLTAPMQSYF
jgi:Oligosaccharyltransferase subunit Ribophorin II